MNAPQLPIQVDNREKGRIIKRLEGIEGVSLEFVDMELGDYLLPGDLVIERKSATDLILSVVDQSLWAKVAKLKSQHAQVAYIIEGDLYSARFHQQALDIHRALAMMVVGHGVSILPSPDADNSGMLIYLMGLASAQGAASGERLGKPTIRRDAQLYLLGSLPGVDADRAEALLRHFGSARAALAADAETLALVEGIDPDSAARIAEVLDFRG
ncbi:ERCC4 domain-containing protein [Thioalkalivibrio sulfidiphilus]|uniref:ERCC4 domain-containing protein n=1 Tax=Thioalkalivibrio sulfidiphilus TaxID=1033854 RepID=UPI003B395EF0